MTKLVPASDVRPAEWVITGVRGFAESVQSLVPEGFPKYARVFHPAYLRGEPVRWAEIASANGKVAHVGMQLDALTGSADPYNIAPQPGLFDYAPRDGTPPINLVSSLLPVLARHTTAQRDLLVRGMGRMGRAAPRPCSCAEVRPPRTLLPPARRPNRGGGGERR